MDVNINKKIDDLESCIITTGVSSLNYYNENLKSFGHTNSLVYNYMGVSSIKNIARVDRYKIVIDFCDNNIKEIVFELLNYLLSLGGEINVQLISNDGLTGDDIEECKTLLNRLEKHQLIKLEMIEQSSKPTKEKETRSWMQKLKNTFFFTGAGNTGKTSLIATLSELCQEKGHSVAMIDLTDNNKLINYFSNVYPLGGFNLQGNIIEERNKINKEKAVNVYTYNYRALFDPFEERIFGEYMKKISGIYDFVFVNADINAVEAKSEIFKIGEKVFIIHDFIPTKINSAKQILLKFDEAGINTKGSISLIYNKMVKCFFNVGFIEENLIFKNEDNKRLVPLVDLNCDTFEIPYSKKTMKAMINHISHKKSIINNVSYNYKRNIDSIYKYINNLPYVEIDDVDVIEYGKSYLMDQVNNIVQHSYVQKFKEEVDKYRTYIKNSTRAASYLIHSRILEKH